ncbi:MAG: ATP-binding protein [Planctomycetota bacterium]|jgi:PAS domain S-box-containing protein
MCPRRVLIVEDEFIVAESIRNKLEELDYHPLEAVLSGEEGVQKAGEHRPDIVLMDIHLRGEIDGIEAASQIRNRFDIPVVYLTAFTDQETLQRAKLTQPYGYVIKPFETRELHTIIEMAIYKHETEQKLRETEQRLAATLKSVGDGLITTDAEGIINFLNPAAEELTGWTRDEAMGKDLAEVFRVVDEIDHKALILPPAQPLPDFAASSPLIQGMVLLARDERSIPIESNAAPIMDKQGNSSGTVVVFRDITERKKAQKRELQHQTELAHAARLSSIGEMASGMAHELNQPLSAISTLLGGCLRIIDSGVDRPEELLDAMREAQKQTERAGKTIGSIKRFARRQSARRSTVDMNALIREAVQLIEPERRNQHVRIDMLLGAGLPVIQADSIQIEQVILNITQNAFEAMEGTERKARELAIRTELNGEGFIEVTLSNTGRSLAADLMDKVFDSFYTTKPQGLGIGLSLSRSIIEAHGGRIWAMPNPGRGVTFKFTIPTSQKGRKDEGSSAYSIHS